MCSGVQVDSKRVLNKYLNQCFDNIVIAGIAMKPKSRQAKANQMDKELSKFQSILNFPQYQQDPIGAIQKHLENSVKIQAKRK